MTDPRDNRGKRHDWHFVLFGVLLATMAGKVLVAEIHRFLLRHHLRLCALLEVEEARNVSDAQLRRLLALVDVRAYQQFHSNYFGWQVSLLPVDSWISFDGKELRGTIDGVSGQKRGLCLVRALWQQGSISLSSLFYHGTKDSEIRCVRMLLQNHLLASQHLTFDALHTQHETLEMVEDAQGTYVAQVKANQSQLLEDLQDHINLSAPCAWHQSWDKGHGRIEQRHTTCYDITPICFEDKWKDCGLATLIVIKRTSTQCKTGKTSQESSFYVSNKKPLALQAEDMAKAIRQHWAIEADHWVRDVTFREDRIRCKDPARSKSLASIISVAGNLMRQQKKGSLKAMQEDIACDLSSAVSLFRHTDVL